MPLHVQTLPTPRDLCAFNKLVLISARLKVSYLHKELADVLALVTLQLNHFSILGVLNYSTIAGKFLQQRHKSFLSTINIPAGRGCCLPPTEPQNPTFLKAFTSFFLS